MKNDASLNNDTVRKYMVSSVVKAIKKQGETPNSAEVIDISKMALNNVYGKLQMSDPTMPGVHAAWHAYRTAKQDPILDKRHQQAQQNAQQGANKTAKMLHNELSTKVWLHDLCDDYISQTKTQLIDEMKTHFPTYCAQFDPGTLDKRIQHKMEHYDPGVSLAPGALGPSEFTGATHPKMHQLFEKASIIFKMKTCLTQADNSKDPKIEADKTREFSTTFHQNRKTLAKHRDGFVGKVQHILDKSTRGYASKLLTGIQSRSDKLCRKVETRINLTDSPPQPMR